MKRAALYGFLTIAVASCNVAPGEPAAVGVAQQAVGGPGGAPTVPTGALFPFAGSAAPAGYLLCDGSIQNSASYPALYGVIGTTYGTGDGSSGSFNLPDLRGRTAFGKDDMSGIAANRLTSAGSGVDGKTLGAGGGAENHALVAAEMPTHNHLVPSSTHEHPIYSEQYNGLQWNRVGSIYSRPVNATIDAGNPPKGSWDNPWLVGFGACVSGNCGWGLVWGNGDVIGSLQGGPQEPTYQVTTTDAVVLYGNTPTGDAGGGAAHPTVSPGVVLNYIIKS